MAELVNKTRKFPNSFFGGENDSAIDEFGTSWAAQWAVRKQKGHRSAAIVLSTIVIFF